MMPKWTQGPAEYERVRKIMLNVPVAEYAIVRLKDGRHFFGWLSGTSQGTDVGENIARGLGPRVTSMWGEIRLGAVDGQSTLVFDAMDVDSVQQAPAPPVHYSN